nr:chromatin-remodeling ATPase INO80-like [Aegilops tauschii subsp. strangulata]
MEYELEATTAFEVGTTSDPNPSKKKKKTKTPKKSGKKRNDGSSSNQSIGLDDEEDDIVVENGKATVPKDNRQVMRNKWEKTRAARDAAATKMSSTWTGIFSVRENKKEERYKIMFDAQKERMEWDRKRVEKKLEIERGKIELQKKQAAIKWELDKAKTFGDIELEKEWLQLARYAEDVRTMLADETLYDEHSKKWLVDKKMEINDRKKYEAARAAAARMQAEEAAQMQVEQAARM